MKVLYSRIASSPGPVGQVLHAEPHVVAALVAAHLWHQEEGGHHVAVGDVTPLHEGQFLISFQWCAVPQKCSVSVLVRLERQLQQAQLQQPWAEWRGHAV